MGYQDDLKQSQGASSGAPKLDIAIRLKLKEVDGKTEFTLYNKQTQKDEVFASPIKGILIGSAMQISAFSDELGPKGGNYLSSYYFTKKDQIALFAPSKSGYEIVCRGDMGVIEKFLVENSTGKIAKKRRVLFLLTSHGLLAVETNLAISIDQEKLIKDKLTSHGVILKAEELSDESNVSEKCLKILGKFIKKNKPKFADMSLGPEINEDIWGRLDGKRYASEFSAFKKYKMNAQAKEEDQEDDSEQNYDDEPGEEKAPSKGEQSRAYYSEHKPGKIGPNPKTAEIENQGYTVPPEKKESFGEVTDDLPF